MTRGSIFPIAIDRRRKTAPRRSASAASWWGCSTGDGWPDGRASLSCRANWLPPTARCYARESKALQKTLACLQRFAPGSAPIASGSNTLVDRIVSAPIEPAGAVAEPYALWAVERQSRLSMPFEHPAVVLVDDLAQHERLKLYILNLGHSWLAERWRATRAAPDLTVRAAIDDPTIGGELRDLFETEVLPGFAARGMGEAAAGYVATTLERFANPFLDHRLADIATNHEAKIERRIGGFVRWVDEGDAMIAMPRLRTIALQSERLS